jgi:pimeloyl-ACP methyl ester carboxylesterase
MNCRLKNISLSLIFTFCFSCAAAQQPSSQNQFHKDAASFIEKKVDVGGYALYISCSPAVGNSPVVILESGMNQSSETWSKIRSEVAKFARVCVYDRAGLGKSDAPGGGQARTSLQIVRDLHALLEKAGIDAPYVLVGHSFGGFNVRLFASSYPTKVAGMVLVDSIHEEETEKWLAMIPPEIRNEMEDAGGMRLLGGESVDLQESEKQIKAAKWRTSIPLIVLARGKASYNPEDYPPVLRRFAPKGEELRIEMQKDLAGRSIKGKFIFAEKSGHFIQQDEPELVIESIRQVVEAARLKIKNRKVNIEINK